MTNYIKVINQMIKNIKTLKDADTCLKYCWNALHDNNISFEEFDMIGKLRMKVAHIRGKLFMMTDQILDDAIDIEFENIDNSGKKALEAINHV